MKPVVVFVLGGPGAGKGTQCARIVAVRARKGTSIAAFTTIARADGTTTSSKLCTYKNISKFLSWRSE